MSTYAITCSKTFMLSHPANHEPEEATVATATSLLRQTHGNRRRHSEEAGNDFFRNWFINGPRMLMKGKISLRAAVFM